MNVLISALSFLFLFKLDAEKAGKFLHLENTIVLVNGSEVSGAEGGGYVEKKILGHLH